ncbi:hypothetical protein [Ensifer adhaerens]|nr:hypothetical protein [Ensifer adhaerens]
MINIGGLGAGRMGPAVARVFSDKVEAIAAHLRRDVSAAGRAVR